MSDERENGGAPRHYWERHTNAGQGFTRPPGEDLAALRRGIGAEPGAAPAMWPFYTTLNDGGGVSPRLWAEHLALTLYGVHQQSQGAPMHVAGVRLGEALRVLRHCGRYSTDAVDARVTRAATATDVHELATHLRGLITMLKTVPMPQGLDYTRLYRDLVDWQSSSRAGKIRRAWGRDYFAQTSFADSRKDQP